jgi:hypothetical protein
MAPPLSDSSFSLREKARMRVSGKGGASKVAPLVVRPFLKGQAYTIYRFGTTRRFKLDCKY